MNLSALAEEPGRQPPRMTVIPVRGHRVRRSLSGSTGSGVVANACSCHKWTLDLSSRTRCRCRRGQVMFLFSMTFPPMSNVFVISWN
jgi:hypothetical protein